MSRPWFVAALLALSACLPEIRIGPKEGIPPVGGASEIPIESLVCGEPLEVGAGRATTRKVAGGCELSFNDDIQVIDEPDYERISDLTSFSGLLDAVELQLTKFAFIDSETGTPLQLGKDILTATLSVNGQKVADQTTLSTLPQTLRLTGEALAPLKKAISKRQPASLRFNARVVLPDSRPPPKSLRFEYQAQPTLVLGGGL